ncbi:fatty acid synthase-like isoform X1 [Diorhabda carinulata]|uniref:fatty acid synthase-like isoform X1 n=1 Tax=Diorhabda carinulata TaxID=1163345 RepID=UPI0025A19071|nr:fatty acid synthase-like isoform X1 [Diorhabda carinulata]
MKDTVVDDKIVITGISGKFPQCENVEEFKDALLNGVDLVREDSRRYPAGLWGMPKYAGTIAGVDKFDASYFGVHPKQATFMDPRHRMVLEAVHESIIDAGYNPSQLRGGRIGVYVGIANCSKFTRYSKLSNTNGYTNIGLCLALAANRISYSFDFKGPSFVVDTACSSSTTGFVCAIKDMMLGEIDGAIVCGTHLIQEPFETLEFCKLNMLSPEGRCKVFSTTRDGYVRSESVVAFFLQRESKSRRIYATVYGAKSNSDGFKKQGITFPSSEDQYNLMKELYNSINITPNEISFIEAHGTGTTAGDIEECLAIKKFLSDQRKKPLLIGSVKSNMGHSEVSSGLCSLLKVIIAMETGIIPANLHTETLDKTLPGIKEDKLVVVTANTEIDLGIVGVNCFGFGGSNTHMVLDSNKKKKQLRNYKTYKNRLVHVSGRTEEAVNYFLDEIEKNQNDPEFLALVDEIHKLNVDGHNYRGYMVLGDHPVREIGRFNKRRPIWFVYAGMGSHWLKMGRDLLNIAVFRSTINRCAKALEPYGIDLMHTITSDDPKVLDNISNCLAAIGAIEIALTDVLKSLNIFPDGMCGHSLGEVGCAYADGQITPEQAVLLAYARGYSSENSNIIPGQMAAVGLSKEELKKILPEGVYIACQNSKNSLTISGPAEDIQSLVEKLSAQGVFTRLVKSSGIPFHTRYLKEAGDLLYKFCDNVLKDPKPRSKRWISSSVPPNLENEEWAQLNCAEYHRNNFCSPVLFDQVYDHIPEDAIMIEIAPHGLLQAILKRATDPSVTHIPLTNRSTDDNEKFFLSAIGKIYIAGGLPNLRNMYNDVTFPVSRGTKMLSPLVKWDHSVSWFSGAWQNDDSFGKEVIVSLMEEEYSYLQGHEIDGRILMPATGYLDLVWDTFAKQQLKEKEKVPIIFENVKLIRATVLSSGDGVKFLINIMKQSGNFEIFESGSVVCTGVIRSPKNEIVEFKQKTVPNDTQNGYMNMEKKDIYKECWLRRYVYKDYFQGVIQSDVFGRTGKLEWKGEFASYLDTMLQMTVLSQSNRDLFLPTGIQQVTIDPVQHLNIVRQEHKGIPVYYNKTLNIIRSGAVEIIGHEVSKAPRRQHIQEPPYLESHEFVQYQSTTDNLYDMKTSLHIAVQIVVQNMLGMIKDINVCEIVNNDTKEQISVHLKPIIDKQTLTTSLYNISTLENLDQKYEIIVITEAVLSSVNINSIVNNLTSNGFILYIGKQSAIGEKSLEIIFKSTTNGSSIILLRPIKEIPVNYSIVDVSTSNFDWLEKLKSMSKYEDGHVVYLVSQEEVTGLMGLVKCLLMEPSQLIMRAVFLGDKNEKFSMDNQFYRDQIIKDLTFNIIRDNNWGTYVFLPVKPLDKKKVGNAAVAISTIGDLSTLEWVERPFERVKLFDSSEQVYVYYSALNFKDIMTATGKIASETYIGIHSCPLTTGLGLEYSGVTINRKRVMGLTGFESISLQIYNDPLFTWEVPSDWTLQEAATVPCVYSTCYYGMIIRGQMKPGESILIHAGTGGIGLSAINIALSMGCEIFTTVSSAEKRSFLKNLYPSIDDKHIGYSRDASFEIMIKENTNGRGVDLVLNSLAGDLFQASMRCLASGGRFLEIGKVDLMNSAPIPSNMFLRNISFHGVHLDQFFYPQNECKHEIQRLVSEGIANGVVKPLPSTVFEENDVESAFRYLATGKHKGKVLLEIRKEELYPFATPIRSISAIPKILFSPSKSYILIGGLGGFGLEVANWLINKGATNIILNSRRGISNGYQAYCLKNWSQYKGVTVKVDTNDTTTLKGAENLINNAQTLGPVGGIFNMALVLKDALIVNQTVEHFQDVFRTKIISGQNMDVLSRKLCPELDHFVVFSSVAAGRGNVGQSNYGMANSALESLCEKRKREQLPGLAIQWGPIGDVGYLAQLGVNSFKSLLAQKIDSCLDILERFMLESYTVVSSIVSMEKDIVTTGAARTPVEVIARILGIKKLDLVDKSLSLSQLGLDSLMLSEIKQTLYRSYNIEYSPEEIRDLTLNSLIELKTGENQEKTVENINEVSGAQPSSPIHITHILQDDILIEMNSPKENTDRNIFFIHPVEGNLDILKPLAKKIKAKVYGFQCTKDVNFGDIIDFATHYIKKVREIQPRGPYYICGYSYGCVVATEMEIQLEKSGEHVHAVYVEGSPAFLQNMLRNTHLRQEHSEQTSQQKILAYFSATFPKVDENEINKSLNSTTKWDERLQIIGQIVSKATGIEITKVMASAESFYNRLMAGFHYEPSTRTNGELLLIRRAENQFISEDYELNKIKSSPVKIFKVNADHKTILLGENTQTVANAINNFFEL